MTKNYYRMFFASVSHFIKINYFLKKEHISQSNFSLFMKGEDFNRFMSLDKLTVLYDSVINEINQKVV